MKKIILFFVILTTANTIMAQFSGDTSLTEFKIKKDGREFVGLKNSKGTIILPAKYSFIRWYKTYAFIGHGTAISGTGLINKQGVLLIDPSKYCDIMPFENGFARVLFCTDTGNIYGYINLRGKEIIPPQYIRAENFFNGTAEVKSKDGKVFNIDSTGKTQEKVLQLDPFEIVKFVKSGSGIELMGYLNQYGIVYNISKEGAFLIYKPFIPIESGVEEFSTFMKKIEVVKFKFKDKEQKTSYMLKLKEQGFEAIELSQNSGKFRKDDIDIWFIMGSNT